MSGEVNGGAGGSAVVTVIHQHVGVWSCCALIIAVHHKLHISIHELLLVLSILFSSFITASPRCWRPPHGSTLDLPGCPFLRPAPHSQAPFPIQYIPLGEVGFVSRPLKSTNRESSAPYCSRAYCILRMFISGDLQSQRTRRAQDTPCSHDASLC